MEAYLSSFLPCTDEFSIYHTYCHLWRIFWVMRILKYSRASMQWKNIVPIRDDKIVCYYFWWFNLDSYPCVKAFSYVRYKVIFIIWVDSFTFIYYIGKTSYRVRFLSYWYFSWVRKSGYGVVNYVWLISWFTYRCHTVFHKIWVHF